MIGAALLTNISLGFADSFFETFAILLAAREGALCVDLAQLPHLLIGGATGEPFLMPAPRAGIVSLAAAHPCQGQAAIAVVGGDP